MATVQELLQSATLAMQKIHDGINMALEGHKELAAIDTPDNTDGLDKKTVKEFRREMKHLRKSLHRAKDDADDAHDALNDIARDDSVIQPEFGK